MAVLTRLPRNPIAWQEINHQRRTSPRALRRWQFLGPLAIALMVVGVVYSLHGISNPTRELALYVIYLVHAITVVRAVVAGANAVSREHVGQTWDALILTGVSARQILLGKWFAAMARVGPWMVMLGAVRLAMLPVFMVALTNRFAWRNYYRGWNEFPDISWVAWASVAAVVGTVLLTILEIATATALGLAASASIRRGIAALIVALSIRFAPVALFAAFTRYTYGNGPSYRVLRFTPFAIADSGTAPLYQLVLPLTSWTYMTHFNALGGLLLAALVLIVMLAGALVTAWLALRLTGALPHQRQESGGVAFRRMAG